MKLIRHALFGLLAIAVAAGFAPRLSAQSDRFEVTGIKAVRPYLVKTLDAVKKNDIAGAKAAFEDYDTAWNGIEVYVNTRDRAMYGEIEQHWQSMIGKELNGPSPDAAAIAGDLQM